MRLWHYELLPYLPDLQFKGQLRELVAIMHDWRDEGETNHILINRVMNYSPTELASYFFIYLYEYKLRYGKSPSEDLIDEFWKFGNKGQLTTHPFRCWHDKKYLRVCMANLYEKYRFGLGKTRLTDQEWQRLIDGYKAITGEDYKL